MPRTLYFDIDGTLLLGTFGAPKAALVDGRLERAVRAAGVERLVCVGNVVHIIRTLERAARGAPIDGLGTVLRVCQGVFEDEAWFRRVTTLVPDPGERARHIDASLDWLWADDLAEQYCASAARSDLYREHNGGRILVPTPDGDGEDVLAWLASRGA